MAPTPLRALVPASRSLRTSMHPVPVRSEGGASAPTRALAHFDTYTATSHLGATHPLPGLPAPIKPLASGYHVPGWVVGGSLLAAAGATYKANPDTSLEDLPAEIHEAVFKPHAWKRKVQIGEYLTGAVKLSEKLIAASDSQIQTDPIRKKTTEALSKDGRSVAWLDATGVMELGSKGSGSFPLQWLAQGEFGLSADGLVSYRVVTPVSAKTHEDLATEMTMGTIVLPTSREALLNMAPGTEVEIKGHATLQGKVAVKAHASKLGELLEAGLRADASALANWQGNIKIRVKCLDDEGNIEVTVEQDTNQDVTLTASLKASLNYNEQELGAWGQERLGKIATEKGQKKLKTWWTKHQNASLKVQNENDSSSKQLSRFVVNARSDEGFDAYRALLRLDLDGAEALSTRPENGVSSYRSDETSLTSDYKVNLDVAGYKLLLSRALEAERRKEVRRNGDVVELLRENELSIDGGNFLSGYENIKWGAVTAYDPKTKDESTFYNLVYSNDDWITHNEEVESLFRFAAALGVEYEHASRREMKDTWSIFRWFTSHDNTKVDVDMYFTRAGVDQVVESSFDDARRAIFLSCAEFHPDLKGLEDLSAEDFETSLEYARDFRYLQEAMSEEPGMMMVGDNYSSRQYFELTGRELFRDVDALEIAKAFMIHKESLAVDASEDAQRSFFVELGRTERFRFMPTILALTRLAGRDNLLVNALAMHGEEIDLDAKSEGVVA